MSISNAPVGIGTPPAARLPVTSSKGRGGVRAASLFGLWCGLFAVLASTLPPSPLLRIRTDEPISVQGVTDDSSTLVAVTMRARTESSGVRVYDTWPIRLIDLRTGEERRVGTPDEDEPRGEIKDFEAGETYQIAGKESVGDYAGDVRTSGDHVAAVVSTLDDSDLESRVQVINWRTGKTVLDVSNEGHTRLEANALLMEVVEEGELKGTEAGKEGDKGAGPQRAERRRRTKIWDLRTGTVIPDIWGDELKTLKLYGIKVSVDNRWLVNWMFDSLRVWDLELQRKHIDLGGEKGGAVTISPNGKLLAVARRWQPTAPGYFTRVWLLFDLPAGRVIREEREEIQITNAEDQLVGVGTLAFVEGGRTIRCRHPRLISDWTEAGFRQTEGTEETMLRIQKQVDGDPTALCSTFAPPTILGISADERWTITRPELKTSSSFPFVRDVQAILQPILGYRFAEELKYQLWRLPEGVPVATLGRGRTDECWFTPDGSRAMTQSGRELLVWALPPSRPWSAAFLGSLAVPAIALILALWKRSRGIGGR